MLNNLSSKSRSSPDAFNAEYLEEKLLSIAKEVFADTYHYAYDGSNTIPNDLAPGTSLKHVQNLLSGRRGDLDQVKTCFSQILSHTGSPEWAVEQALVDIASIAEGIFSVSTLNDWKQSSLKASYWNPDGNGGCVEVRAVYVHANLSLNDGSGGAGVHSVVYYLGVYFG